MQINKRHLQKLEAEIEKLGYQLRYEKGNFNGGYCVVKNTKVVVVSKFFSLEGKVAALSEIIRQIREENHIQEVTQLDIEEDSITI